MCGYDEEDEGEEENRSTREVKHKRNPKVLLLGAASKNEITRAFRIVKGCSMVCLWRGGILQARSR